MERSPAAVNLPCDGINPPYSGINWAYGAKGSETSWGPRSPQWVSLHHPFPFSAAAPTGVPKALQFLAMVTVGVSPHPRATVVAADKRVTLVTKVRRVLTKVEIRCSVLQPTNSPSDWIWRSM